MAFQYTIKCNIWNKIRIRKEFEVKLHITLKDSSIIYRKALMNNVNYADELFLKYVNFLKKYNSFFYKLIKLCDNQKSQLT